MAEKHIDFGDDSEEYEEQEEEEIDMSNYQQDALQVQQEIEEFEKKKKLLLTTEGVSELDVIKLSHQTQTGLRQCECCIKFFEPNMICNQIEKDAMVQCHHCYFWMNYSNKEMCDSGVYGPSIVEYILNCQDAHKTETCTRLTDAGGCFLCEFKLGLPMDDIKNIHLLRSEDGQMEENESDCSIDDIKDVDDLNSIVL